MVVKLIRWQWPPLISRKYEVRLTVKSVKGLSGDYVHEGAGGIAVEIKWKGPKIALSTFRRTDLKRNCTREESVVGPNGVVQWGEEFQTVCNLSGYKENVFHPWEIALSVFSNGFTQGAKTKVSVLGTATLNLAEFAAMTEEQEFHLDVPLVISGSASQSPPSLCISISLLELRAVEEPTESVPSSSPPASLTEKEEVSTLKAGLRKVKMLTEYVSFRRAKKTCREEDGSERRCSFMSDEGEYAYPFDSDSLNEYEEGETDESMEDSTVRKSFSYGSLTHANCTGEEGDWIYYSNRKTDAGCSKMKEPTTTSSCEPSLLQNSKRSILPWRKRKLSFRSPKTKGEPLLKKDYGEEGGDDIDFDRRQLSSDESYAFGWCKTDEDSSAHRSSVSEFGDDNFAVGCWEQKEIMCRDGQMKLQTQIFFASIDQRSEQAAGESACTALVAVIADWLQNSYDLMPVKSQFDTLIREGSSEWRKLCDNEINRERFPDKHFDLETVLQAKIRSISVVPGKSFIGFFHPDGMDEERFDFLHGAMSFDNIWDEISQSGIPQLYIISWNDHFFVLKVESEAYYIIDTLGERLYEGCNQAYILKFDRDTTILKPQNENSTGFDLTMKSEEDEVVCRGKESCKEYIKSFLAAIPIRELQEDIKKGLITSLTPLLHQRLQIEFHFTELQQQQSAPSSSIPTTEVTQVVFAKVAG